MRGEEQEVRITHTAQWPRVDIYARTLFIPCLLPHRGPKATRVVPLATILSKQQPCEVGQAESVWLAQSHRQAPFPTGDSAVAEDMAPCSPGRDGRRRHGGTM